MNSHRSQAYGTAIKTLRDLRGTKLHPREFDTLTEAADAMLFADDAEAMTAAEQALQTAKGVLDEMVEADRLTPETRERILAELRACGMQPVAA